MVWSNLLVLHSFPIYEGAIAPNCTWEFYSEENEAIMFHMIDNSGHGNSIGTKEGTQAEAYDIGRQPFFDVPSANYTAFYADGPSGR
jgi:hypothetical protein